jgi:hypothetical protein
MIGKTSLHERLSGACWPGVQAAQHTRVCSGMFTKLDQSSSSSTATQCCVAAFLARFVVVRWCVWAYGHAVVTIRYMQGTAQR